MSETSTVKPDIINYKTIATHNGRYRLRKILPANVVGQEITLAPTAIMPLDLNVPSKTPFNLARSCIEYQLEIDDPGAGLFNWVHDHTLAEIESIKFGNNSGADLVDLQYASNYVTIARKLDTDLKDFQSQDATSALYPDTTVLTNYYPPSVTPGLPNAYGLLNNRSIFPLTKDGPVYLRQGLPGAKTIIKRSIPLSAFTHTALAMDRDMMSGEELQIKIKISGHEKLAYRSDAAADPTAAATISAAAGVKMTGIRLLLAVQVDPVVEDYVRKTFEAGHMKFIFPFQYAWKVTGAPILDGQTGQVAFQQNLTNQHGRKLKRVLLTAFNVDEKYSTAFDANNMNAAKLDLYRTAMDSQPLQDEQVSCVQLSMDDFRENRHLMKGSVLDNSLSYYLNWFHCDSFSNPKRGSTIPEDNILEGLELSLNQARTWSFSATAKKTLVYYMFAEFIRHVEFSPQGPTVMSVA